MPEDRGIGLLDRVHAPHELPKYLVLFGDQFDANVLGIRVHNVGNLEIVLSGLRPVFLGSNLERLDVDLPFVSDAWLVIVWTVVHVFPSFQQFVEQLEVHRVRGALYGID